MKPDEVFDVFKCLACNDFGTKLATDLKDTHVAAGPNAQTNRVTFTDPPVVVTGHGLRNRKVNAELDGGADTPARTDAKRT